MINENVVVKNISQTLYFYDAQLVYVLQNFDKMIVILQFYTMNKSFNDDFT